MIYVFARVQSHRLPLYPEVTISLGIGTPIPARSRGGGIFGIAYATVVRTKHTISVHHEHDHLETASLETLQGYRDESLSRDTKFRLWTAQMSA